MASTVIQWMLDTRPLWPEASQTKDLPRVASRAMTLLPATEQSSILRYHFLKDAKLSLASHLLKRLAISRFCHVSWPSATATPDPQTKKPIFPSSRDHQQQQRIVFNVSHQAGVVVLFAVHNPPPGVDVGVDIVCPAERGDRDRDIIARQGWAHYVRIHEDVLCPRETRRLLSLPRSDDDDDEGARLDYFYALWCLREAYVKMTGEALLAPWLADLEMRGFAPPRAAFEPGGATTTTEQGADGIPSSPEVWFRDNLVEDVDIRLQRALAGEFMICTAMKKGTATIPLRVGRFEALDWERVLAQAEALGGPAV